MVWEYAVLELAICEVDNPLDMPSNDENVKKIEEWVNRIQKIPSYPHNKTKLYS